MTEAASDPLWEEITALLFEAREALEKARALAATSSLYAIRRFGWNIQDVVFAAQSLLDDANATFGAAGEGDRR